MALLTFTTIAVNGRNGAGTIDLTVATLLGPFAPGEGDKIIAIREGTDEYATDDSTGFASVVGSAATLHQYDASDLSAARLIIVIARLVAADDAPDDAPVIGPSYFAIFTTLGLTRLAEAQADNTPLVFTHLAVGDGGGAPITPSVGMTALVNETARVPINGVEISPDAPTVVRVEGLLISSIGGFMIREAGLFNHAGELIAVASYPPIYKPVPAEGVTVEEYIRILLVYATVSAIALTTDPDVITATRLYVDDMTSGGLEIWEKFT